MAASPLDGLGLPEAELRALARVAQSRLAGRPRPSPGKYRRKAPASAGGDFQGLREYVAGDSLRAVNWLASARSSHIQTQVYESELASRWHICLDGSASMGVGAGHAKWLLARQISAAFAYLLLYGGNQAGLMVFSGKVDAYCPPGRGHSQWPKLLNLLKDCQPHPPGGSSALASCSVRLPAGASVLVVSDFLDDGAMRATLGRWHGTGMGIHAIQVLADDECGLPPNQSLSLRDIETGEQCLLESTPGIVQSARLRLLAVTEGLGAHCAKRMIPFTSVDPAKGWKEGLLEHFTKFQAHP